MTIAVLERAGAAPVASAALVALLARVTERPAAAIGADSDLAADLGLDSLGRVQLAALVAEELGADLDDGAVAAASTVTELGELLAAARARGAGAEAGAWDDGWGQAAGALGASPAGATAFPGGANASDTVQFPRWGRAAPARWTRDLLQRRLLFPLVDGLCGPITVTGREHLVGPRRPVLLAPNHSSHLDTLVVLRALPDGPRGRLAVAAAADYWYARRAPAALVTLLLGAFPLARQGAVGPSLAYCGELARTGWSLLVYPEGTRSPDGRLQPFRPGVGLLATALRVPVVPVHLAGTHACLPRGARWPRRARVAVRFGAPLRFAPGTPPGVVAAELAAAVRALGEAPAS
jgi:long-chain acyl-CoA synthetase